MEGFLTPYKTDSVLALPVLLPKGVLIPFPSFGDPRKKGSEGSKSSVVSQGFHRVSSSQLEQARPTRGPTQLRKLS